MHDVSDERVFHTSIFAPLLDCCYDFVVVVEVVVEVVVPVLKMIKEEMSLDEVLGDTNFCGAIGLEEQAPQVAQPPIVFVLVTGGTPLQWERLASKSNANCCHSTTA